MFYCSNFSSRSYNFMQLNKDGVYIVDITRLGAGGSLQNVHAGICIKEEV